MSKQIILSNNLVKILERIEHRFSKILLESYQNKELVVINSYIDSSSEEGMVSYLPAKKEQNIFEEEKWTKYRQKVSFGKVIRAILNKKKIDFKDNELEDFVNEYKVQQTDFEIIIVNGDDIIKWYKESNYDDDYEGNGSLYGSCMKNVNKEYLEIYKENASMLCIISKKGKLLGRAILWENVNINGKDLYFLDRMYCVKISLESAIKSYCRKKGWFYKVLQGAGNIDITNGVEKISSPKIKVKLKSINGSWELGKKPYIDTLCYFGYNIEDGILVPMLTSYESCNFKFNFRATDGSFFNNVRYNGKKDLFNKRIEPYSNFLIKYSNGFSWIDDTDYTDNKDRRRFRFSIKLVKDDEEIIEVIPITKSDGRFVGISEIYFINGKNKIDEMQPYHCYLFDLLEDDIIFKPDSYRYLTNRTEFRVEHLTSENFRMVLSKNPNIISNYLISNLESEKIDIIMELKPNIILDLSLNSFLNTYKNIKDKHILRYLEKYPDLVYINKNIKIRLSKKIVKDICQKNGIRFTREEFGMHSYINDNNGMILVNVMAYWFGNDILPNGTKIKFSEFKENSLINKILKGNIYEETWYEGIVTYSSRFLNKVKISNSDKEFDIENKDYNIVDRSLSECVYLCIKRII